MFVPEGQGSLSQTDRPAMWCPPAAGSAQRPSAWCHSSSSWQDGSPGLQMNHETAETLCVLAWYVWRGQRLHRQLWAVYHAPVIHTTSGHLLASCPLEILAIDFTKNETASDGKEDVLVFTKFFLAIPTSNQEVVSHQDVCSWVVSTLWSFTEDSVTRARTLNPSWYQPIVSYMASIKLEPCHTIYMAMPIVNDLITLCLELKTKWPHNICQSL